MIVVPRYGAPSGLRVFADRCGESPVYEDLVHDTSVLGLVKSLTNVVAEPERKTQCDRGKGNEVAGGETFGFPDKELAVSELVAASVLWGLYEPEGRGRCKTVQGNELIFFYGHQPWCKYRRVQ